MARYNLYLKQKDRELLFEKLFDKKYSIMLDVHSSAPHVLELYNLEHLSQYIKEEGTKLFFLKHECYNIHPIEFDSFEKNSKTVFFIKQRYGGPFIDFLLTSPFIEQNQRYLRSSFIELLPDYYHTEDGVIKNEKIGQEIQKSFKELKNILSSISKKVKIDGKIFYIGSNLMQDIDDKKILLL